jgi:anti-anti-sigma regulatory factor
VRVAKDDSGRVLTIASALDIGEAEELHRALRDFVCGDSGVVVDLSEVDACDTTALQLLCSARKTAARAARPLRFTGISAAVRNTASELGLSLAGWDQ